MSAQVGPGILAQMQSAGDGPYRDSDFGRNADGSSWERGYGFLGVYVASNVSGDWKSAGPLPVAQ